MVPPAVDGEGLLPGTLIADKYLVERIVGEGGIGLVVAARHVHLDQTVAIKYLRPNVVCNPAVTERFLREARLAAKIRSEHVVHVYDVGTLPDGAPYMVMEYLAGTDLGRLISASGPLALDRAIDYVLQACEALAEAHVAGVVHRDLKPDNLFLASGSAGKSVVKILDFGISKMSTKREMHTMSGRIAEMTQADDKFGTPVYMSPEQLRSAADVDPRADVWAIGVVLYELLTGKLPFDRESLPELCTAILHETPTPLTSARPYLPVGLQAIVERCLEKDRADRYQNVAEFAQELRPFAVPAALARIDHVVRVIREAGEDVRAPTPTPDAMNSRAMHAADTLGAAEGRNLLTTGSAAASWGSSTRDTGRWRWGRATALSLLGLAAAGVIAVFVRVSHPAPPAAAQAAISEPASHPAAAPVAPPVTPEHAVRGAPLAPKPAASTSAAPAPAEAEPTVAIEFLDVPPPATATATPRAARPKAAGTGSAKAAMPAPNQDPSATIDPFE